MGKKPRKAEYRLPREAGGENERSIAPGVGVMKGPQALRLEKSRPDREGETGIKNCQES